MCIRDRSTNAPATPPWIATDPVVPDPSEGDFFEPDTTPGLPENVTDWVRVNDYGAMSSLRAVVMPTDVVLKTGEHLCLGNTPVKVYTSTGRRVDPNPGLGVVGNEIFFHIFKGVKNNTIGASSPYTPGGQNKYVGVLIENDYGSGLPRPGVYLVGKKSGLAIVRCYPLVKLMLRDGTFVEKRLRTVFADIRVSVI